MKKLRKRTDETLNDKKERLKSFLIDYIQEVTQKSKGRNQYICLFCNSGTGHNGTGAFTYYPDSHTYKCFACGEYGDIFTLHAKLNNLLPDSDFPQIIDNLAKTSIWHRYEGNTLVKGLNGLKMPLYHVYNLTDKTKPVFIKEHLAENIPTILRDRLRKLYSHVSRQDITDYITQYATYNPILNAIIAEKSLTYCAVFGIIEVYFLNVRSIEYG